MSWLRRNVTREGVVTTSDSWLVHQLTREFVTDASTASRSLLTDLDTAGWDHALLDLFGLGDERLPDITSCDAVVRHTTVFGGTPAVGGLVVDQQAALVGEGCLRPGEAKCTFGNGAFLLANTGTTATRSGAGLAASVAWQVFQLPGGATLDRILLPVPTKRTKGVLVFPTLDGKVVAGPTAVDQDDKTDWTVRRDAAREILEKAVARFPALEGLDPVASYVGLRTAGRGSNYVIGPSASCARLVNVAATRSTGLTASLGIGAHVTELLPGLGVEVGPERAPAPAPAAAKADILWWQRTARRHGLLPGAARTDQ